MHPPKDNAHITLFRNQRLIALLYLSSQHVMLLGNISHLDSKVTLFAHEFFLFTSLLVPLDNYNISIRLRRYLFIKVSSNASVCLLAVCDLFSGAHIFCPQYPKVSYSAVILV